MEGKPGRMAKLNPAELLRFAAATTAMTLSTSRKLIRNFNYYKTSDPTTITKSELLSLYKRIRFDLFSLQNLLMNSNENTTPYIVSLSGQIFDQFEELHRKLLFFDPDLLVEIIPVIDEQRKFWVQRTDIEFYNQNLLSHIENRVTGPIQKLEKQLEQLPDSATL